MSIDGICSALRTRWLRAVSGHRGIHRGASVHWTVDFREARRGQIVLEPGCDVQRGTWLNVPSSDAPDGAIHVSHRCAIGRRCVISARNSLVLEESALLAPHVLLMDHAHEFADVAVPIRDQGVSGGGRIVIGRGCWIGFGACVIASRGEVCVGANSVVAANSVVTRSIPPCCVAAGAPARVVRQYDPVSREWRRCETAP